MLELFKRLWRKRIQKRVLRDTVLWLKMEKDISKLKDSLMEYDKGVLRYAQMKERIRNDEVEDNELKVMERYETLLHNHKRQLREEARRVMRSISRKINPRFHSGIGSNPFHFPHNTQTNSNINEFHSRKTSHGKRDQ